MGIIKSYIKREHTDLNELRYRDSSTIGNEPIVQKKIPSTLESRVPKSNEINRRLDDLKRVARVMAQPGGAKFLGNEALLYTSVQSTQPGLKGKLNMLGAGLFNTVKVLGSTLAQVPVNGTGTHFVKGFLPKRKFYQNQFDIKVKKEGRLNYGDPGLGTGKTTYNSLDIRTQDRINLLGPIIGAENITKAKTDSGTPLEDLIKFRFTVVTPDEEVMLPFRAYLTEFSDSYNSDWSSYRYLGRAENFNTYQGMTRSISLGFKIAAQTRDEMRPLYQKMVYLASSVAPTYSGNNFMRGTFVKATVGSYIYELPGFINTITYAWNTDYPWEIALNKKTKDAEGETPDFDQQELPMVLDCSINFTPIHKFAPQTGLQHYFTQDVVDKDNNDKLFFKDGKPVTINLRDRLGLATDDIDASLFSTDFNDLGSLT